jgi:hypothetical protein
VVQKAEGRGVSDDSFKTATDAMDLAKRCHPIFAGQDPDAVGAALCELVAMHLAGHIVPGEKDQTDLMRQMLLEAHVDTVKNLIPVMEAMHILPKLKERMQ